MYTSRMLWLSQGGREMNGLMMDYPLTLTHILERSAKLYPRKEIRSRLHDG